MTFHNMPYLTMIATVMCPICKVEIGEHCVKLGSTKPRDSAHKERWNLAKEIDKMKTVNCVSLGEMCEAALDGEPVFILRAKDKLSVKAVGNYLETCILSATANVERTKEVLARMNDWRFKNQDKIKLPD